MGAGIEVEKHTTSKVPYNLARRICTIVSDENMKEQHLEEQQNFLEERTYPRGLIQAGINKAKRIEARRTPEPYREN